MTVDVEIEDGRVAAERSELDAMQCLYQQRSKEDGNGVSVV